jgi:hypothetical protein
MRWILCALLLGAAACAPPANSKNVIGRVHATADGAESPSVLYVRGQQMIGDFDVTFRDGHSYVGDVCLQSVPPTSEDDVWASTEPLDPARLSDDAVARIATAPFVRTRVAHGASTRAAVAEYCAAQDRMLAGVSKTYLGQPCGGPLTWEPKAIAKIDTRIAEASLTAKNPPRIGRGDYLSVWFEGMGYRSIAMPANSGSYDDGKPITLQFAKNLQDMLSGTLGSGAPTVVIWTDPSASVYMKEQAFEVLKEIDELKASVASNASTGRAEKDWLLHKEMREEILSFARGHQGKL